jgi:hypothetical protein
MSFNQLIGSFVVATILAMAAPAAEPVTDPTKIKDAAMLMEGARGLRKLVDQGDADGTYRFALLVAYVMSGQAPALDESQSAELRQLSERKYGSQWMLKAAELGSQPAIEAICRIGQDPLAPARLRDQGKARCEELRAKYPAP